MHKVYEIVLLGPGFATVLVVDGQVQVPISCGDRVIVHAARPRSRWSASPATASTGPCATSSAGRAPGTRGRLGVRPPIARVR